MTVAFRFGEKFERRAVKLGHEWSYIHPDTRNKLKQFLDGGCYCNHDGQRTASLTQRMGGVWLQCDACGSAVGHAMKRDHHSLADKYPQWRRDLGEAHEAARQAHVSAQPTHADVQRQREEAYKLRAREYEEWCRRSPEWAAIKKLIFWRCRGHCEACLGGNASVVHHITYQFGKIPPAWHLKAVCEECHDRLHSGDDDWCDWGMAR